MKKLFLLALGVLLATGAWAQAKIDTTSADKLGWQLAIHSYTFQKFSIFDAIDKANALGVKYMSISGSLILDGTNKISTVTLSDEQRTAIDQKLRADGFGNFVNMGVVQFPANEAKCRKVFEFAKKWRIGILVAEPQPDALDTVEKLCKEYNIKVAIHDHPRGHSIYWNPDFVLAAIKGRTPLMGACADVGVEVGAGGVRVAFTVGAAVGVGVPPPKPDDIAVGTCVGVGVDALLAVGVGVGPTLPQALAVASANGAR